MMNRWIMLIVGLLAGVFLTLGIIFAVFGMRAELPSRAGYESAMHATSIGHAELVEPGSEKAERAIAAFKEAFSVYTRDHLKGRLRSLYAEDAYFNDNLIELRGSEAIEKYFLESVDLVESCHFDIEDVAHNNGNYYLRWTMTMRLKNAGQRPDNVSTGVTLLRFNPEGRIILHQDYWDSAALMRELPVVGGMINYIKRRIAANH